MPAPNPPRCHFTLRGAQRQNCSFPTATGACPDTSSPRHGAGIHHPAQLHPKARVLTCKREWSSQEICCMEWRIQGAFGVTARFSLSAKMEQFTNLYCFDATTDGAYPDGTLTLAGDVLYGTTYYGGSQNKGMVFAIHTDGTGLPDQPYFASSPGEGAYPEAGLLISGRTCLWDDRKRRQCRLWNCFRPEHRRHRLHQSYTISPMASTNRSESLVLSSNTLYGITIGSPSATATIFKMNTNGTGFMTLHSFPTKDLVATGSAPALTNNDGALPTSLIYPEDFVRNHILWRKRRQWHCVRHPY